ncbi:MAG: DUF2752 domain-containing protein [Candidatus Dormibacteria bacterium]
MLAISSSPARRLEGVEPGVAVVGVGVLTTAWVLPGLWARGVNPVPPCIFHLATGLPCPMCGATRSFAAMAHGNLAAAVHVFPIGPLMFLALLAAVVYSTWAVITGRRLHLNMDLRTVRILTVVLMGLLAVNWASKLFILGY